MSNDTGPFAALPSSVRDRIDNAMANAGLALKVKIGKLMADNETWDEHAVTGAGRVGLRSGQVSELTAIMPFKPGGAANLRKFFELTNGNLIGATEVGTLHDMRFVFLDNDTKLLFATAYDGDWDAYIDDFATKVPEMMDYIFHNVEGWPGITSPTVKDFIVSAQIPATAWFVGHPSLTVADVTRLRKQDAAVHQFLDQLN